MLPSLILLNQKPEVLGISCTSQRNDIQSACKSAGSNCHRARTCFIACDFKTVPFIVEMLRWIAKEASHATSLSGDGTKKKKQPRMKNQRGFRAILFGMAIERSSLYHVMKYSGPVLLRGQRCKMKFLFLEECIPTSCTHRPLWET